MDRRSSFTEQGYVRLQTLCPAIELPQLRGLFPSNGEASRTLVHAIGPAVLGGLETIVRARAAAASIFGADCTLEFAQWYCKPAGSPEALIPWHQDREFWSSERPHVLTTWIALDQTSVTNGCLRVSPRSHVAPDIRVHRPDPLTGVRSCTLDDSEANIPLELDAGSGVIYHERLVHCSGGNETSCARRALVLGWKAL